MRWICILVCSAALAASSASAQAQAAPAKTPAPQGVTHLTLPPVPKALLPDPLPDGSPRNTPKTFTDAAQADPANAAALKEYDFTDGALANYKRSGETLSLRALRFHDASGAYGAYSFYRQNGWPKEEIGTGATSNHNRVLFWVGNTVVDANFSRIGPMSGAELRELAGQLPVPEGSKALPPPILGNLPKDSLDGQTTHYALGPAGYAGAGGVLPPELVGFDRGAEAVTANYTLRSGPATLTIIDYPTPQMAAAQETKIRAYIKAGSQAQPPWPKPLLDSDARLARGAPQRAAGGPGQRRRHPRREPQAAGHGALRVRPYVDPSAHGVGGGKDRQAAARHRHPGDHRRQRRHPAGILPGRRAGAVPHGARKAGLLGLRRRSSFSLNLREEWVELLPEMDRPHPKG